MISCARREGLVWQDLESSLLFAPPAPALEGWVSQSVSEASVALAYDSLEVETVISFLSRVQLSFISINA